MGNNLHNIMVVKIGGSTLGQHDTTLQDLVDLQKCGQAVVVVHGGGKVVTDWLARMGASTKFIQGERVTDKVGLEVVTAVLAGLVNKELVASICAIGGRAAGISGVDGAMLLGRVKNHDLGYVGNLVKVDIALVIALLEAGYLPVISSISLNSSPSREAGDAALLLNVNADTVAGDIAAALKAEKLIYLTDIAGVCDKDGNVIPRLSINEAESLITSGVATSGMIPKIRSCITALNGAGLARIIDGRQPHALYNEIDRGESGTTLYKNIDK